MRQLADKVKVEAHEKVSTARQIWHGSISTELLAVYPRLHDGYLWEALSLYTCSKIGFSLSRQVYRLIEEEKERWVEEKAIELDQALNQMRSEMERQSRALRDELTTERDLSQQQLRHIEALKEVGFIQPPVCLWVCWGIATRLSRMLIHTKIHYRWCSLYLTLLFPYSVSYLSFATRRQRIELT